MDEDEKRLFEAVRSNPEDDSAREVYADWLERQGDPRGRYLRLEVLGRRFAAEQAQLRRSVPEAWQRQVGRSKRGASPFRSFDLTLTLSSAWLPRPHALNLVGRVHGFDLDDGGRYPGDRGLRSVFDGEHAYHVPLSHTDVSLFLNRLDAFEGLMDGTFDLHGVTDSSDVGHDVTLQGVRADIPFRASVQFLSSGFMGRSARDLVELGRVVFAGTPVDASALLDATRVSAPA